MASGGLPQQKQMPPPRGWTPGAASNPAQIHTDEANFQCHWKRLVDNCQNQPNFNEKVTLLNALWHLLVNDNASQRLLDTPQHSERMTQLIRLHLLLAVDPKWIDELNSDVKQNLLTQMSAAENVAKKCKNQAAPWAWLKKCHINAWDPPILREIFSNKPTTSTVDYFNSECYEVCMRRLQVLVESQLEVCAYNMSSFLIKHVFEDFLEKRPKFVFLHQKWLKANNNRGKENAYNILDIHLALLYKRKKDTSKLQYLLKSLPIEVIIAAAEKCRNRSQSDQKDWITLLWSPEDNAKATKTLLDHAMCVASRKKLENPQIKTIVTAWLNSLNFDPNDSNLDLEVEKYVALDEHSTLSYIIGHRLVQKYGQKKRELCLEQMVRGLCCDINKLEVARSTNDEAMIKHSEKNLSYGLWTLAEIMKDNLTFRRECILTAFSLNPNHDLFREITQLAQESGFTQSSNLMDSKDHVYKHDWNPKAEEFDDQSRDLIEALKKGFGKAPTKVRANTVLCEKKDRNLEGLISIQGDLITEAKNYNPVKAPLQSLTASALGIKNPRLVDDLLITIDAPRWHLLSWVLDWPQLEEQCQALLRNPDIRRPTKELKYLVIDYTQFDEWSSEEEITATTGIEKGYENWANKEYSDEEDAIVEKGLGNDKDLADFNAIPILKDSDEEMEEDDDDDQYVYPNEYLKKQPFLVNKEETDNRLLQKQQSPENVRAALQRVVPGLNGDMAFSGPKKPVEYEIRVVQISANSTTTAVSATTNISSTTSTSPATSVSSTSNTIAATGGVASSAAVLASATSSAASGSGSQSPSTAAVTAQPTSKVQYVYKQGGQTVLIDYPMNEEAFSKLKTTTSTLVVKSPSMSSTQQQPQQVMITTTPKVLMSSSVDTLANSLISQITAPVNVPGTSASTNSIANGHESGKGSGSQSSSSTSSSSSAGGVLPKFQFAFGRGTGSADSPTKATSSEIQVNGGGTPRQIHLAAAPSGSGQPQRCIVQMGGNGSPTKTVQYNIVKPAGGGQATAVVQRPLSVVVPVGGGGAQAVIANARTVLANQQQQQKQQQSATTTDSNTHADLIRQLNMARAQGLVVLQHWGDKQVLVHKATGRWIMRQGNRLVTVPPQALGITTASPSVTIATAATVTTTQQPSSASTTSSMMTLTTNTLGQTIKQPVVRSAVMSSSTMEQLAEFDSILESKFKSSPSPTPAETASSSTTSSSSINSTSNNSNTNNVIVSSSASPVAVSTLPKTNNSGPTFVIITPSSGTSSSYTTSYNSNVMVSSMANAKEATTASNSKLNGNATNVPVVNTMKIVSSSSAPSSPVKAVKMAVSSVSANSSPTTTAGALQASGFVKPPPKPQEDPDTLKRIQQILDDYNEQIRNSPDLQNRPAPRRRTNGPTPPNATGVTTPPPPGPVGLPPSAISRKRPSLSSGSPNSSSGSESPLMTSVTSNSNDLDMGSSSVVQVSSLSDPDDVGPSSAGGLKPNKPIVRQIMVPPALAASLQATGRQLMVITGPGGKKMIALRPLSSTSSGTASSTNTASQSTPNAAVAVNSPISNKPITRVIPMASATKRLVTSNTSNLISIASAPNSSAAAPSASTIVPTSASPIMASNAPTCSPSPPSLASSSDDRPVTPGLGIPMEMTPGQIMEAEISASFLEDDDVHPTQTTTTSTFSSLRHGTDADDLETETLPEDLFTHDQPSPSPVLNRPPVITEETEVDTDDITEDEAIIFSNNKNSVSNSGSRKRVNNADLEGHEVVVGSGGSVSTTGNKRSRQPSSNSGVGVRTRQRNSSSHLKKSGITESSRASASLSKK